MKRKERALAILQEAGTPMDIRELVYRMIMGGFNPIIRTSSTKVKDLIGLVIEGISDRPARNFESDMFKIADRIWGIKGRDDDFTEEQLEEIDKRFSELDSEVGITEILKVWDSDRQAQLEADTSGNSSIEWVRNEIVVTDLVPTEKKLPRHGTHKAELFERQKIQDNGKPEEVALCHSCLKPFVWDNMDVDHKIPKSRNGTDHIDNLHLLCSGCNRKKKRDQTMSEFKPTWETDVQKWRIEHDPEYMKVSDHEKEIADKDSKINDKTTVIGEYAEKLDAAQKEIERLNRILKKCK